MRLVDRDLQTFHRQRIFRADVNQTAFGSDGVTADRHGFEHGAGVAFHDGAVHERARVAFVGVADDVFFIGLDARCDLPLQPGRETGAAAAADAGVENFLHDVGRLHLEQGLGEGLEAFRRDVFFDVFLGDDAAVAQGDALLLLVEGHLLAVGDLGLQRGFDIDQTFDQLVADDVLLDDVFRIFGFDFHVEDVVGHDLDDRALGAETEASGLDHVDVFFQSGGLDFGAQIGDDVLTVGDQAAGIAADEDVFLLGIGFGPGQPQGQLQLGGIVQSHQVSFAGNLFHAFASLALISSTTATALAGVSLP